MDGHDYVDGAILENLPTPEVKAMGANVVLAVSLELAPVGKGDLNNILGVLQRAFAVGIEANEARDRKLANVVVTPDVNGFNAGSYDKVYQLAERGYAAAAVGYDRNVRGRPILLIMVKDKPTGPPFLLAGFNLEAQTTGVTRATVNTILLYQDLGGYGSEWRTYIDFGFYSRIQTEYYRKINWAGFFVAPRANLTRTPYYIYSGNKRLSERLDQSAGGGADFGWSNGPTQEIRAGWQLENVRWYVTTGFDGMPEYRGNAQTARLQYTYDSRDRALVPEFGVCWQTDIGYLYATPNSPSAPQLFSQLSFSRTYARKNVLLMDMEGATMLNRDVAQPFRFTLGGPLRLSASAIDQYRGTDYFLVTPGYLYRIKSIPAPLSSSLYLGGFYEAGQMRAPDAPTITQQDVFFGLFAETPFGLISFGPALGTNDERKLVFTIGKFL